MAALRRVIATAIVCSCTQAAAADEAMVQTPAPAIHLQDNLDEADGLGWCIDTVGRGWSEHLHAHSCKPQGGDVQFAFDQTSGTIRSVAFTGKCVVSREAGAQTDFGLVDCDTDDPLQRFYYNSETLSFNPEHAPESCIAVGENSRSAGPFMSRDLVLRECRSTDPAYQSWIIKE